MPLGGDIHRGERAPADPVEMTRTLLAFLRRRLGLEVAWLSSFGGGDQVFELLDGDAQAIGLSPGDRLGLSASYCMRVIDGRLPSVIADTAANQTTAELPVTHDLGLGAYVGVPVRDEDGAVIGMLCAVSKHAKPELHDDDMRVVTSTADLIGALVAQTPLRRPRSTTTDLGSAMRRVVRGRDFEVVFHAIHDVATGGVVGVEALARFPCEPFRPDLFFEQAAEFGLDVELELAVVERVISLLPVLPPRVFVAVNISPAAALAAPWTALLADTDPARIVLEITEHDAVEDYTALDEVLERCRARGVRVAVDDVGAGFSSFSHVLELSPEFVKIDRSITHNIHVDDARKSLAHSIGELAQQMGAIVIAEGVETQDELDAVSAAGVSWAQGYHLGRPKPHTHGFPAAAATAAPVEPLPAAVHLVGERRFELALTHSPIGMAVVGLDGRFLRTNRALTAMLGYPRRELAALTFQEITHPEDLERDLTLLRECLDGRRRSYRMDKRFLAADGGIVWGDLTVVLVCGPRDQPQCFVSQILDVTADRIREADLARQASTDPLTGIANRAAAWSRLDHLDARGQGYGILFCDIERFKSVNDRRGHHAGDELLVEVSERLRAAVGEDDVVARWGGDEFLVITGPIDEDELARVAERITKMVQGTPIVLADGTEESVAFSIGYAGHTSGDGRTIETVIELADHTMYERRRQRSVG